MRRTLLNGLCLYGSILLIIGSLYFLTLSSHVTQSDSSENKGQLLSSENVKKISMAKKVTRYKTFVPVTKDSKNNDLLLSSSQSNNAKTIRITEKDSEPTTAIEPGISESENKDSLLSSSQSNHVEKIELADKLTTPLYDVTKYSENKDPLLHSSSSHNVQRKSLAEKDTKPTTPFVPVIKESKHQSKMKALSRSKNVKQIELTKKDATQFVPVIKDSKCLEYSRAAQFKFKKHINVNGMKVTNHMQPNDVTLLTQLSANRMPSLQRLILSWEGPISAAIYTSDISNVTEFFTNWLKSVNRQNVQIHLVEQYNIWYPVNVMRNVAQDNAMTQYVFMLDVDFLAMPNLYATVMYHLPEFFKLKQPTNSVMVIMALQVNNTGSFPETKAKIQEQWKTKVNPFIYNPTFIDGEPTDYDRWVHSNELFEIPYTFPVEAYFVLEKHSSPSYDEMFLQRWYDKVSHILELYSRGFHFWVSPHGYVVHLPHERVKGNVLTSSWRCANLYFKQHFRKRMDALKKEHDARKV